MSRPRFSEMLFDRRRQLGLSIAQASRVLRLKPQVLQAFEDGDFPSIPKSGYAQGMLSSYARYLGLNTRVIVSQFSCDLQAFEATHGTRATGSDIDTTARMSSRKLNGTISTRTPQDFQGRSGLLPTSGGYAGDMHDFATTSEVHSRETGSTISSLPERHYGRYSTSTLMHSAPRSRGSYLDRPFTNRQSSYMTQTENNLRRNRNAQLEPEGYDSDSVQARSALDYNYVDDLRYDAAHPYEAASSQMGRRRSRNIAPATRPHVQRQTRRGSSSRNSRQATTEPLWKNIILWFFDDPRRLGILGAIICVFLLSCVIIFSINSCVKNSLSSGKTVTVTAADTSSSSKKQDADAQADDVASQAAKDKAAKEEEESHNKTEVEVSVNDGEVSWVEIVNDGKSQIAQQVTGPWDQSYVVTDTITIQVSNPGAVRVTKNGTPVKFDTKTAGIGSVTIKGTKPDNESDGDDNNSSDAADSNNASQKKDASKKKNQNSSQNQQNQQKQKKQQNESSNKKTHN